MNDAGSITVPTAKTIAADIARELRNDLTKWTQFVLARNENGDFVTIRNPTAVCWCLRGAIDKRIPEQLWSTVAPKIYAEFEHTLGFSWKDNDPLHLVAWNDKPERTANDIIDLCDKIAKG